MSKLDYFRRPVLAGNTLRRTANATIRGNVRRKSADGVSSVPYFPGIATKSLLITIESTTYSVGAFTNDSYQGALDQINAVIGGHASGVANGEAFDSDGSISIRSTTTNAVGSLGSVEITGGTAAALLGFDITYRPLKAYGGEIVSAPEGRVGNPFRTAFVQRSEKLDSDSVNRGLAMLASNSDSMNADLNREDATLMLVGGTTNNSTYITIPAGVSVPIFPGTLLGSASKEQLAPFFQIIDQATKQPYASRVVAVVKGPPVGTYPTGWPYTNQTIWSNNLGLNLLGQTVDKMAAGVAISSIIEGRFVECPGASFLSTVAVEDFVFISGATNTDKLNNNGFKWVVEKVISNSALSLRPMSSGELNLVGTTTSAVQPQIELASDKVGAQSYGNLMVRTGAYATVPIGQPASLNLVVYPPIQVGATPDVWMAQPVCLTDSGPFDNQQAAGQSLKTFASDLKTEPDGLMSYGTPTGVGTSTINIPNFYARWNGRVIRVGAQSVPLPVSPALQWTVVYWNPDTNAITPVIIKTSSGLVPTNIFNGDAVPNPSGYSSTLGFPVAFVFASANVIAAVQNISRVIEGKTSTLTVGHGGDFQSLSDLSLYLFSVVVANSETSALNGTYAHFDIVLLSDQTVTDGLVWPAIDCTIRGVNRQIRLNANIATETYVFQVQSSSIRIENLILNMGGPTPVSLVNSSSTITGSKNIFRNLRSGTGLPLAEVVSGSHEDVLIEDCSLSVCRSVVYSTGGVARDIVLSRCRFTYVANVLTTAPTIITPTNFSSVSIEKCSFLGGWVTTGTFLGVKSSVSTAALVVRDSSFALGAHTSASNSVLFDTGLTLNVRSLISNVIITSGKIPSAVSGSPKTAVENCSFTVNPESGIVAVAAGSVFGSVITHVDTDASTNGGIGVQSNDRGLVVGNQIQGPFIRHVDIVGMSDVKVSDNFINMSFVANARPNIGIAGLAGFGNIISGNSIFVASGAFTAVAISMDLAERYSVSGNVIGLKNPTAASAVIYGVAAAQSLNCSITGNTLYTTGTRLVFASQGILGVVISGSSLATVSENDIKLESVGNAIWIGIDLGSAAPGAVSSLISHNTVQVWGKPIRCADANTTNVIDGNIFSATSTNDADNLSSRLSGVVSNNRFSVSGGTVQTTRLGAGTFTGNIFHTVEFEFVGSEPVSPITFSNNIVESTGVSPFTMALGSNFSEVEMVGNTIGIGASGVTTISGSNYVLRSSNNRFWNLTISTTFADVFLSNSFCNNLTVTAPANIDSSLRVEGCQISGTIALAHASYMFIGCAIEGVGPHTLSGVNTNNNHQALLSGCTVSGAITSTFSDLFHMIGCVVTGNNVTARGGLIESCEFRSACSINGLNVLLRVSDCHLVAGSSISIDSEGSSVNNCTFEASVGIAAQIVRNCVILGSLTMTGFQSDQTVDGNYIKGGLSFNQDNSYPQYVINGNKIITSDATTSGIYFPSFTFNSGMHISITNNDIKVGTTSVFPNCHVIFFAGTCSELTLVGNSLAWGTGSADPVLGAGTFDYALLYVSSTNGSANAENLVSSNRMVRTAASTIAMTNGRIQRYWFWWFGQGSGGNNSVIGAGNMMQTGLATPNTVPHNGSPIVYAGGTPYTRT